MAGLYVHIPFCRAKCGYCRFVSAADTRPERMDGFLDLVGREAKHAAESFDLPAFDSLYLGGGTPSVLGAERTARLFEILRTRFRFARDAETTIEVNPGDVCPELCAAFARLGINRASIGLQTMNEKLLTALGRLHRPEDNLRAVESLRAAGIENISLDLMVSLPGQCAAEVEADLAAFIGLAPGQVTVYELTIEEGTRFRRLAEEGLLDLPDEEEQMKIMRLVSGRLESAGFVRYELLSYARPGFESRHNLNYWHNGDYLGLGPGAFSYLAGSRGVLARSVAEWFTKVGAQDFVPAETERLSPIARECESLILGLRLKNGVREADFPLLKEHLAKNLPPLESAGLVRREGGRLRLGVRGKLLAETVFEQLVL